MDHSTIIRIEKNRAAAARWYIARHRALYPEHGAAIIDVAGGIAAWPSQYGARSMGKAIGIALDGELTSNDLDRIEALYREPNVPTTLSLCPLTHESAFRLAAERRYVVADQFNVLARPLSDAFFAPTIHVARTSDHRAFSALVRRGMGAADDEDPIRAETTGVVLGEAPQMHSFIASIDGEPAGAGGLLIDEGVASLFATSVLPEHRRKGVQASLIATRLAHAKSLGCDLAVSMTDVGSESQRNLERNGFRVGYTATVFSARSPGS